MNELHNFLKKHKLLILSSVDEEGNPWISSVYYAHDDKLNMYFVSKRKTNHSKHFMKNNNVAYSVAWHNPKEDEDRIAIQAKGTIEELSNILEIAKGAKLIFNKYDDWEIEPKSMIENLTGARMYKITPNYIKFWNDKLFGKPATREYVLENGKLE